MRERESYTCSWVKFKGLWTIFESCLFLSFVSIECRSNTMETDPLTVNYDLDFVIVN